MDPALSERTLDRLALAGAALTVVVVAASALLRLGTTLDAGGNVAAELPAMLRVPVRLAHRIAASGVAIVAVAAVIVALAGRVARARAAPLAAVVALTALLAIVGPLTPGHRFAAVTVANALGGVALACAFLWLRGSPGARATSLAALAALAVLFAHAGLGTAASAASMHGEHALDAWHVAAGPAIAAIVVAAATQGRHAAPARALRWTLVGFAVAQMALGMALLAAPAARPLAWAHALGACAVALALAALAKGVRRIP